MNAADIVAYTYRADMYCPNCIIDVLTVEGGPYDGWALGFSVRMPVEDNLDEIADAFGIDRHDESTFDGDDFPKVVFAHQVTSDDHCGSIDCWTQFIDDEEE